MDILNNSIVFISRRLRFKNSIAMTAIAISYLVMIIAVAVSSGFRREIRSSLSGISGDVQLTPPNLNVLDNSRPVESDASYLPKLYEVQGVESIIPVVYRNRATQIQTLQLDVHELARASNPLCVTLEHHPPHVSGERMVTLDSVYSFLVHLICRRWLKHPM